MVVDELTDQWICSYGNWVDQAFDWCPDCCDSKVRKRRRRRKPRRVRIRGSLTGLKVGEPSFLALLMRPWLPLRQHNCWEGARQKMYHVHPKEMGAESRAASRRRVDP